MNIVLNCCYGPFIIPDKFCIEYDIDEQEAFEIERTDQRLVDFIRNNYKLETYYTCLKVFYIPDNATDYMILDYDGCESCIYVLDGKLYYAVEELKNDN